MNNALINKICTILNIEYKNHKHFTDGVSSKVFVLNDLYLVKQSTKEALRAEVMYLKDNISPLMQEIVYIDEEFDFVVYKFIKGEVMYRVDDPKDAIEKIIPIIAQYKPTILNGYGYMDELVNSWEEFLRFEIRDNDILRYYVDDNKVNKAISNLNKYPFTKCLIHGDFGTHNFIKGDGLLVGVIDPMTVLGDPLYDLLFAIVSNTDILKTLTLEDIYKLSEEDNDKIKNLLIVVLYARMIRCLKYHREDIDFYLDFYKQISL